jgi:hypothetical protein
MRVFISSTVYDLLDARAELAAILSALGMSPVLSDDKLSDFAVQSDANSIHTCLVNVATSDIVLVVLDQRYGPKLGAYGFDDVSATHLEYRHAKEHKKRIYFFVRDRLEADYAIWRKNINKPDIQLSWAKDVDLLNFLHEHRKLTTKGGSSNWCMPFTSSLDLKEAVERLLKPLVRPQLVVDAIAHNRFPLFVVDLNTELMRLGYSQVLKCKATIQNVGGAAAFNFRYWWSVQDAPTDMQMIVAPSQTVDGTLLGNVELNGPDLKAQLFIEYDTVQDVRVRDIYDVNAFVQGGAAPTMISGATLKSRSFLPSAAVTISITEPSSG